MQDWICDLMICRTVGDGEVAMEEDKKSKIREAEQSKNKKQVRSFLGLANYYRKCIANLADVASPLSDLTKKSQPTKSVWGQLQEDAFTKIKKMLTEAPVLRLPNLSLFIVQCDASESGVGQPYCNILLMAYFP